MGDRDRGKSSPKKGGWKLLGEIRRNSDEQGICGGQK